MVLCCITKQPLLKANEYDGCICLKWEIENFSEKTKESPLEWLPSPCYSNENSGYHWLLWLYPKGDGKSFKDYMSLFLSVPHHDVSNRNRVPVVNILFSFYLIKSNSIKLIISTKSARKLEIGTSWGFPMFIKRSDMDDPKNGYLEGDKLTILCNIKFAESPSTNDTIPLSPTTSAVNTLSADFTALFIKPDHSDVIIITADKSIHVHKAILAARSPVFAAMFSVQMLETTSGHVSIVDLDSNTIEEMLRYIYSGKVSNLKGSALKLIEAAEKYDLPILKEMCEEMLCQQVNLENAVSMLVVADKYGAKELKKKSLITIKGNYKTIGQLGSTRKFLQENPFIAIEILNFDGQDFQ